jgi:hypothetical protein
MISSDIFFCGLNFRRSTMAQTLRLVPGTKGERTKASPRMGTKMRPELKALTLAIILATPLLMAENSLTLQRSGQNECRVVATMANEVAGLQFTLVAAGGMKIVSVQAGAGVDQTSFLCVWNQLNEHTLRVLLMGRSVKSVLQGDRELLRVTIEGASTGVESEVQIDDAVLADARGQGLAVTVQGLTWSGVFAGNDAAGQLGNYPNPFNPSTMVSYTIHHATHVRLAVYDILGREVVELVNANLPAGHHRTLWTADNRTTSSGVYFARLEAGGQVIVSRMSMTH